MALAAMVVSSISNIYIGIGNTQTQNIGIIQEIWRQWQDLATSARRLARYRERFLSFHNEIFQLQIQKWLATLTSLEIFFLDLDFRIMEENVWVSPATLAQVSKLSPTRSQMDSTNAKWYICLSKLFNGTQHTLCWFTIKSLDQTEIKLILNPA